MITIQTTANQKATTVCVLKNGKPIKGFSSLSPIRANAKRVEFEWIYIHNKPNYN